MNAVAAQFLSYSHFVCSVASLFLQLSFDTKWLKAHGSYFSTFCSANDRSQIESLILIMRKCMLLFVWLCPFIEENKERTPFLTKTGSYKVLNSVNSVSHDQQHMIHSCHYLTETDDTKKKKQRVKKRRHAWLLPWEIRREEAADCWKLNALD